MKFDSLTEALEEFKQRFPELAEKIENPAWQKGNRNRVERLKKYIGNKLIEAPIDDKSLNIKESHYDHNFCEKEGMLVFGEKDLESMSRLQIKGIKFWNPLIVEQHLEHLSSRQTLESVLEEDSEFVIKVEKVFEKGWASFLRNEGYEIDYFNSFDAERFKENVSYASRTLLHPTLVKKITTAYDLITTKERATKTIKDNFAAQFPDFEEVLQELIRNKHKKIINNRGWWFEKDIERIDPSVLLEQYKQQDQIINEEAARKSTALRNRIKSITFKRYVELEREHPDLKEKIDYIAQNKGKLLPTDYKRIYLNNIIGMPRKRRIKRGYGRLARFTERESDKEYDVRIIDTVNHLYELLQKREQEPQTERPLHQQERINRWMEKGRKTDKITQFVEYVLEKTIKQEWYKDFQKLVNGFRFTGDYRINTSKHWSRQNMGFYVSAGQVKGEWGWNTLVSGSEKRFDTPGMVLRQLRDDKEEKYVSVADKFEALVNESIDEFYVTEDS